MMGLEGNEQKQREGEEPTKWLLGKGLIAYLVYKYIFSFPIARKMGSFFDLIGFNLSILSYAYLGNHI